MQSPGRKAILTLAHREGPVVLLYYVDGYLSDHRIVYPLRNFILTTAKYIDIIYLEFCTSSGVNVKLLNVLLHSLGDKSISLSIFMLCFISIFLDPLLAEFGDFYS